MFRTLVILVGALGVFSRSIAAEEIAARAPAVEIKTAAGFEVTRLHAVARESQGSWISIAADDRGRLYVSDQYGPLHRVTLAPNAGAPEITPLKLPVGGLHGLAWHDGALYAIAGQKALCPTGLYRIRDTDSDGELDQAELLRALEGDGEHGPHAVAVAPDGKSLYVLAGNATRLPELARSRVPRVWGEDSVLAPLPALMGSETRGTLHGGWICRTDLDGREWELVCVGFRNAYALAFDSRGELFTFDSDTEFEINLPWYRPTRVLHAVSGADFGWRRGALKVPEKAPDNWPTLLPIGLGSPTAVLAPTGAKFPVAYRDALWVADWSYGKLFVARLTPSGSGFTATREEVVSGNPLPITALCVNPLDGAIYFTTGGRRLQSALYRLRWMGPGEPESKTTAPAAVPPDFAARRRLEALHGRDDPAALAEIWPGLASADALIRRAARVALEARPPATWAARALAEKSPHASLTALLALARSDARAHQREILAALQRHHERALPRELRGEWLRVLSLAFSRGGEIPESVRAQWAGLLEPMFPSGAPEDDAALLELLVFCAAPNAAAKGIAALRSAVTRQTQIEFAKSLRVLRAGWTPMLRREFFEWLAQTNSWRGGASFGRFLQKFRDDALAAVPETERAPWRELLVAAAKKSVTPSYALPATNRAIRAWTTDELTALAQKDTQARDAANGRKLFAAVGCFGCHTVAGEGGALGPDLTGIGGRLAPRDLIEAIVEPNREISDQYGTVEITTREGRRLGGRIVNLTENGLHLAQNLADPSNVIRLAEADVVAIEASRQSLMPAGLLNALSADEILDLLAFLRSEAESR